MKEMITVEKEVYEAVLRNSVRVNDLEVENQQLKELLERASYCIIGYRHNDHLPERVFYEEEVSNLLEEIDNAIGEK